MGALSADRQITAMPKPSVRTDFDEPLDIHRNVFAQIAFHRTFRFDHLPDAVDLVFGQILHLFHRVHFRFVQNARRARVPDSVDVSERDIHVFVTRKIDAGNTSHNFLTLPATLRATSNPCLLGAQSSQLEAALSLTLLMFGILANHPHHTLALDDLALIANFLYRCSNFLNQFPLPSSQLSVFSFQQLQLQTPRFARDDNLQTTCSDTQSARDSGRKAKARPRLCLPAIYE